MDLRCDNCDKNNLKTKRLSKDRCKEVEPARNHQENVTIKVRQVEGHMVVTSEEDCVREDSGSILSDDHMII